MVHSFIHYSRALYLFYITFRVAAGNPGYLVAVNPTNTTINVNFLEEVPLVSEEVTIQLYSSNYSEPNIEPK